MDSDSWLLLLFILILLGCSAFFSASETAISMFNKVRMRKKADEGDKQAKTVMSIWDNYDKTLYTILIGNNIVNITSASLATVLATRYLGTARGAAVATIAATVLVLLFGESLPKVYSKEHPNKTALAFSTPLTGVIWFLTPLSLILSKLNGVFRGSAPTERSPSITEEELIYMMDAIEEEGILEEQERELVQSALEFDEITIREILTPRVNIIGVEADCGTDELRRVVVEEGYSRIPVYEKTIDNVIGVLYARDIMLGLMSGGDMNIREMMSEALFVHKGMKLSHLLSSFKARKLNLAVVVDEYGGTSGIVTMEDVLEELVGDIWDEYDEIPKGFTETEEDRFEVAGGHDLWDMFERLGIDKNSIDSDCSTVSGWALQMLGHIPEAGEEFTAFGHRFTALEMNGHRLEKLGIYRLSEEEKEDAASLNEKDVKQA